MGDDDAAVAALSRVRTAIRAAKSEANFAWLDLESDENYGVRHSAIIQSLREANLMLSRALALLDDDE